MKISASIYSSRDRDLIELVKELDAHNIDSLHVDCLDEPAIFEDIVRIRQVSDTPIDLHLITSKPDEFLGLLKESGVQSVVWQLENLPEGHKLEKIPGISQGIAIVSNTDLEALEPYAHSVDFVLMMTTVPGQSGGEFNQKNFKRIRQVKSEYPKLKIHVDGGVNQEVSFILRNLGVDMVVSGSYLVNGPFVGASLINLKEGEGRGHFSVRDIMIPKEELPVVKISEDDVREVLKVMEGGRRGFVLFEDENEHLAGICSNADLRRALIKHFDHFAGVEISELINENPIFIHEDKSIAEMVELIKGLNFVILFLPVTDKAGKLLGAVTFNDLIKGEL